MTCQGVGDGRQGPKAAERKGQPRFSPKEGCGGLSDRSSTLGRMVLPLNSYVKAPNPTVTVFGDRAFTETIKVT